MKIMASPMPTSTRPSTATENSGAKPIAICPAPSSAEPVAMSAFGPTRSSATPTGTCIAA